MSQRSMEVKVGALILVSLALLAGFVVVMGGMSLEPTYRVYVDFDNPGGLQSGAPIRISGVKVGRVTAIEFRGGKTDPKTNEPEPPIRSNREPVQGRHPGKLALVRDQPGCARRDVPRHRTRSLRQTRVG